MKQKHWGYSEHKNKENMWQKLTGMKCIFYFQHMGLIANVKRPCLYTKMSVWFQITFPMRKGILYKAYLKWTAQTNFQFCLQMWQRTSRLETWTDGDNILGHARRDWTGSRRQTLNKLLNVSVQSVWLLQMKRSPSEHWMSQPLSTSLAKLREKYSIITTETRMEQVSWRFKKNSIKK